MSIEQSNLRRFGVIVAPDKIVIPEHFAIARTARIIGEHPEAYLAAIAIAKAAHMAAIEKKISN